MNKHYIQAVKCLLLDMIEEMSKTPSLFVVNPERDFTRNRKIDFATFMRFTLCMAGSSMKKELFNYFDFSIDTPSVSASTQQRAKVLPEAFEFLFHEFTSNTLHTNHLFSGYRLLACDGSRLTIATIPDDAETHIRCNQYRDGINQLHLNVIYDLPNRIYVDAIIQNASELNEFRACTEMINRSQYKEKVILIGGYENYNIFAHIHRKEMELCY